MNVLSDRDWEPSWDSCFPRLLPWPMRDDGLTGSATASAACTTLEVGRQTKEVTHDE